MGWMNYNGVLQVGSTDQGLYLGVVVFFRVGHRSLLIPWDRVREIGPAFSILKRRIKVDLDGVTATFFEDAYRSAESKRP